MGSLFSEAYDDESTPLKDALSSPGKRYSNFSHYSEGGLKSISLCYDKRSARQVAMATLKEEGDQHKTEAFIKEARLNAALQHPNIVPVYDVGLHLGKPWFTMKFIAGKTLGEVIEELRQGKTNDFSELSARLDLFLKVCDAIAYAHSRGILHLDIKPDNIRISEYGDVVILDWGLADIIASECDEDLLECCSFNGYDLKMMTTDGVVKGTLGYMAPEQTTITGKRKGKHTDIFSLGAILYSLLCYEKAFEGAILEKILYETAKCYFDKPSARGTTVDIPYSVEAVCLKAMSLEIDDRYEAVEALQKEILAYRNGFATHAEDATLLRALLLLIMRHKTFSLFSLLTITLLISLCGFFIQNLKLAKKNAVQLAEKHRLEKEFHIKMGKDAAPRFLERAQTAYVIFEFDDSMNFCNSAVELDNSLKEAWELKGTLHFIRQEFNRALEAFKKAKIKTPLTKLCREFSQYPKSGKRLANHLYLRLMQHLLTSGEKRHFANLIHQRAYSKLNIGERIEFCKGAILIHNKSPTPLNFNYNKLTRRLDLSNNTWLHSALCLQNFPCLSIDVSNTALGNFICFRNQKLISLNVSSTNIIELQTLENRSLRELYLANTSVQNLNNLRGIPLQILDISHTLVKSPEFAHFLPYLRELYLHRGQFTELQLSNFPQRLKIIYRD